jgi:TRAP-type C4-dicarboxylate transport system substrate-binding protein
LTWRTQIAAALLVLAGLAALPASAQVIKLGTIAPEGSPWLDAIRGMADEWKAATGGKIEFRIYPGGVVGDDPDMVRKMRIGQLQAAALSNTGLYDIAHEMQALQMPMMLTSYEELDYVRDRMAPKLEAILEAKGFKVLNWGDAGWIHFFSQQPLLRPDDLKPMKLWVWAGYPAYVEAWKDGGFHPVELASTDILTGLQAGLINAFPAPPLLALANQWFGAAKQMCDVKWAPAIGATVITMKSWQAIDPAVREKLLASARAAGLRLQGQVRKLDDEAIAAMQKRGLVVNHVTPEGVAEFERVAVESAYPKLIGSVVPADIVAEVKKLRDEFRARTPSSPRP